MPAGSSRRFAGRGTRVVLCTSSRRDHLVPMLQAIGAHDAIDGIVNGDDVDHSKPAPDLFAAALEQGGLEPGNCVVVGDTRWDIEAAERAGLETVSVLTGGASRQELVDAGACGTYDDVADLLRGIDESPLRRTFGST